MMLKIFFLLFSSIAFASIYEAPDAGIDFQQNPSSITWLKIDTDHFEIIFPEEAETEAHRVAHLLEAAYPIVTRSLEVLPPKIPLILQNQSTVSNGFVTFAPKRSEWYLSPAVDPELGNTEWLKTLAIHEFRHVVQFQKSRRGFNKIFGWLFGEIGQALGGGLSFPPWFLEGDAVGIETAVTQGGRGRLPLFERDLRALLLSGQDYSYEKAHLGSFEDYIPNHYVYGYFYTTFMRNRHGDLFLSKLANDATEMSYWPLTFYTAYSRRTGEKFESFYKQTMKSLITEWAARQSQLKPTPFSVKNLKPRSWTNYLYPQQVTSKHYLALKKGLSHIDQFVLTDGKEEKTVLYPGVLQNEYPFQVRRNRFAFVEWEFDPRWGYRDFARIKVFDLKEKKVIADFAKTKGRLAQVDPSGNFVLYVEWETNQKQKIKVRNLQGKEVYTLSYPRDRVITSLDWFDTDEIVMVVKDFQDMKEVVKLTLTNGEEVSLLPKSLSNLGYLTSHDTHVFIESPQSGIDNIYEVKDQQLIQLTTSRYGAYSPSLHADKLIYADYSPHGMQIAQKELPWQEEQNSENSFVPFYEKFAQYETQFQLSQDQIDHPVTPYSQVKNSLNFHSWLIFAPPLSPSLTLMGVSRDVMNKFALTAGGSYYFDEQEAEAFVSAAWSHYYPVFDLRGGFAGRRQNLTLNGKKIEDRWEESSAQAGVQLPWKKITGRFIHSFTLRAFAKILKVTNKMTSDLSELSNSSLFSPGGEVSYSVTSRVARRDINPAWGLILFGNTEEGKDISGKDQEGALLSADSRVFLPGFFDHHSFFHQFGYEKQRDSFYQYASYLLKPRGTSNVFLDESRKYSGNYLFPLAYPDLALSRYVYFKRVAVNLFYDEMTGRYRNYEYRAASTGWELLVDTHFLRIFIPLTLGVRGSYVLDGDEKANNYEFFITSLAGYF